MGINNKRLEKRAICRETSVEKTCNTAEDDKDERLVRGEKTKYRGGGGGVAAGGGGTQTYTEKEQVAAAVCDKVHYEI